MTRNISRGHLKALEQLRRDRIFEHPLCGHSVRIERLGGNGIVMNEADPQTNQPMAIKSIQAKLAPLRPQRLFFAHLLLNNSVNLPYSGL
jgi:hypothetical protein